MWMVVVLDLRQLSLEGMPSKYFSDQWRLGGFRRAQAMSCESGYASSLQNMFSSFPGCGSIAQHDQVQLQV